jgi:hypothetical protein
MSLAVLIAFYQANQAAILSILLILSEFLGANPKIKSNGIVSFVLQQVRQKALDGGAKDPTP